MTRSKKPRPEDLLDNTAYLVMDLGRLYRRLADAAMRELDLQRPEWWLITHLWFFEGCSQQELADVLDMDKAGLGKLLDRLARAGIVERQPDPRDARQRRIVFTAKGRVLAQQVDDASVASVRGSVRGFKPLELAALNGLMRRLREALLQAPRTQGRVAGTSQVREDLPKPASTKKPRGKKSAPSSGRR